MGKEEEEEKSKSSNIIENMEKGMSFDNKEETEIKETAKQLKKI